MAKNITYSNFIEKYIRGLPADFKWQSTPLQIYPLVFIAEYLVVPTPLLKADYHFIIYLKSGTFRQQVGIEMFEIKSPSILYVPEQEIFSIISIESEISGFFVLLETKVLNSIINKVQLSDLWRIKPLLYLKQEIDDWFNTVFHLLHYEISSLESNRSICDGFLQAILHKLISLDNGRRRVSRQDEIANSFKSLVNKHAKEQQSVGFYAAALNVSENYLNRCVKTHYRKNSKQIIQETNILQSQILIIESWQDISEIAFEMGYADPSYFSRVFKKVTGQTPSQFRSQVVHGLS